MTGPPPATAAVRVAVRRCLADLPDDAGVAAAVSGGADSLALAAALAFERTGSIALVVDHGLQPGSADVAARAAEQCRRLGLHAEVLGPARPEPTPAPPAASACFPQHPGAVESTIMSRDDEQDDEQDGERDDERDDERDARGGPEAAARAVRYRLLGDAADRRGLDAVLLGHTLDDQAETVLLGLARGSGARALAGMPARRGVYRRPLLDVARTTVRAACAEAGLEPHDDPHNRDDAYTRSRVRRDVLPVLEAVLGPGVAASLARSAGQLRADADALDAFAVRALAEVAAAGSDRTDGLGVGGLDVGLLAALLPAVRTRVLKRWAEQQCGGAVTSAHVQALRALVEAWRGQGAVSLPAGVQVVRRRGRLTCTAAGGCGG